MNLARIAGVDIPRNKRVEISLTYIYGIGKSTSNEILEKAKVNKDTKVKDLTEEEVESFHQIRTLRNNIAHGRKVNLDVKSVTEKNKTLTKLAKKVDLHITNHFMISQI